MKAKKPDVIKVSDEELGQLLESIKSSNLSEPNKKIVITVLETYYWLSKLYQQKKLTLKRIKRLFSFKTEKLNTEKSNEDKPKDSEPPSSDSKTGSKDDDLPPTDPKKDANGNGTGDS